MPGPIGQTSKNKTSLMNKKPLTRKEITAACDEFFPLFDEVMGRMPVEASVEDCLKALEHVQKLASYNRNKTEKDLRDARFGFNKLTEAA